MATVFAGGPLSHDSDVTWLQSSNKDYSSELYGSRTALYCSAAGLVARPHDLPQMSNHSRLRPSSLQIKLFQLSADMPRYIYTRGFLRTLEPNSGRIGLL
jgi:hypothetical protein